MVILQCGLLKIRHNIRHIRPYKSDTKFEYITTYNMYADANLLTPVIYFYIILKLEHLVYNCIQIVTLTLIHIGPACEFYMTISFFSHRAVRYVTI